MAKYSEQQRRRNQRTITIWLFLGAIALTIGWAIEAITGAGAIGLFLVLAVVVGIAWWLFAGKKAATIDGQWVDGWNHDGHTELSILTASDASAPGVPRRETESELDDEWEA